MNIPTPTRSSVVSAINAFTTRKSLSGGKSLHAHIIKLGFLPQTQLYNHLLNMYSKCFDFTFARKLFDEMPERNLVSYSTLISGYSQSDTPQFALDLGNHLHQEAITMNQFVFSSFILACSKLKWIKGGKQIHAQVIVSDFESDPFVRTSLIDMYSKFGDLDSMVSVFGLGVVRDSVMYNSMISGFVSHGLYEEAVKLFGEARWDFDLKPSEFTFGSLVKACSNLMRRLGEQIHGFSIKTGFDSNCFVGSSLVDMYGKFGDMESANNIFQSIESVDLALYNAMIVGFSGNNSYQTALELFVELKLEGFGPNVCTFSCVFKACGGLKCIGLGRIIHGLVVKSEFSRDLVVNTALIDMYMKCACLKESIRLFDLMSERNAVLYNSMIFGLGQCGDFEGAVRIFIDMNRKSIDPDEATFVALMNSSNLSIGHERIVFVHVIKWGFGQDLMVQNALLDSLIKGGAVDEARWLFNKMHERNVISWTSIISGLSELGLDHDALALFKEMNSAGLSPNSFTFSSILKACGSLADLEKGRCIHGCTIKHGIVDDEFTDSALLDMYARSGALEESFKMFEEMPKRDVVSWNTMITACAQHGKGQEALGLFKKLERYGVDPNQVSFTSLLSACSHCGLIEEGVRVFESISNKHNMVPSMEHHACMVDMFGRAGMLDRVKSLIDSMPYEPDVSIWKTFLAACKLHGDLVLAQLASDYISVLEGGDNTTLVSLSNIYSELGRWDDVERVRRRTREMGRKEAGLSWVQISDKL
ncbi:hypothetical protein L1049_013331 [Liquidambar formosana]|uniref:Pentatricopeptide repeat-containing protein n=1 Tax=Liquidambar formosana TaxID=63359 RepID=A0AAP0RK44_LIQFO